MVHRNLNDPKKFPFYVYVHRRDDTGEIFYVGKGSRLKEDRPFKRAFDESNGRSNFWKGVVSKAGGRVVEIVGVLPTEEGAFVLEKALIRHYRRRSDGGTLVNLTEGGDGVSGVISSPETIRKRSEGIRRVFERPEYLERCRDRLREMNQSPERRAQVSSEAKDRWASPGYRERLSQSMRRAQGVPERKERASHTSTLRWQDPLYRDKVLTALASFRAKDPERAKRGLSVGHTLSKTPEFRAKTAERTRKMWENPAFRERRSQQAKASMQDPEFRAKAVKNLTAGVSRRRPVCDIVTGEVFPSAKAAARSVGFSYVHVIDMLNGKYPNKTNLRFVEPKNN